MSALSRAPRDRVAEAPRSYGAYAIAGLTMFLVLASANVPTPLYDAYRREWGFSPLLMTAVFATYPLVLVVALLAFARLAEAFGRKPVLAVALLTSAAGSVVFAGAGGLDWLFAARVLQAISVALLSAAGTAALLELDPARDARRATVVATMALALGTGTGALVAGFLVQFAPAPHVLPYLFAALAVAPLLAALLLRLPETALTRSGGWLPRLPRLPRAAGFTLGVAGFAAGLAWACAALFISVVPSYLRTELHLQSPALAGVLAFVVLAVSALVQLRLHDVDAAGATRIGIVLCVAGVAAIVAAVPLHTVALLALAVLAIGAGHAFVVVGTLAEANRVAPADARAETLSLYYAVLYLIVGLPIVGIGLVATTAGFFAGFVAYLGFMVVAALAVLVALRRHSGKT
jgi:MFS family permease